MDWLNDALRDNPTPREFLGDLRDGAVYAAADVSNRLLRAVVPRLSEDARAKLWTAGIDTARFTSSPLTDEDFEELLAYRARAN